jgi:hypothetical protein
LGIDVSITSRSTEGWMNPAPLLLMEFFDVLYKLQLIPKKDNHRLADKLKAYSKIARSQLFSYRY